MTYAIRISSRRSLSRATLELFLWVVVVVVTPRCREETRKKGIAFDV